MARKKDEFADEVAASANPETGQIDANLDYGVEPGEHQNPEMHPEAQYSQITDQNDFGTLDPAVGGAADVEKAEEDVAQESTGNEEEDDEPDQPTVQAKAQELDLDLQVDPGDESTPVNPDLDAAFAEADRLDEIAALRKEEWEDAERAAVKARYSLEDDISGHTPRCPHDGSRMIRHSGVDPAKAKAWHCNGCGCCWAPGVRALRAGTPACNIAVRQDAPVPAVSG